MEFNKQKKYFAKSKKFTIFLAFFVNLNLLSPFFYIDR